MRAKLYGLLAAALLLVAVPAVSCAQSAPAVSVPKHRLGAALTCTSFTHPKHQPVLLVPGYGVTPKIAFGRSLLKALAKDGYDTCTINPPGRMVGDMQKTAAYIASAVRTISARTGSKVDVVGHSEGAATSRWAIKWWPDVRSKVDDLVTIAGGNHGVPMGNLACATGSCAPAAWQLRAGSKFMAALNAGDETPGRVDVTSIYTMTDELVQPFTVSRVRGATNVSVQSVCPGRVALHGEVVFDAVAYALMTDALSHPGRARPSRLGWLTCLKMFAPGVTAGDLASYVAKDVPTYAQLIPGTRTVDQEPALKPYARP
jgi:triacylglycerol lipase